MDTDVREKSVILAATICLMACMGGCTAPQGMGDGGPDMGRAQDMDSMPKASNVVLVQDEAGNPVVGVDVVINDKSGAVVQTFKTSTDGQVAVAVPPGGMVAVYQTTGTDRFIDAVANPPPGVKLTFAGYAPFQPDQTMLDLTLTGLPAATTQVFYMSGCSSGGKDSDLANLQLQVCQRSGKYDVIVLALDAMGKKLAWGALVGQTPEPGETVRNSMSVNHTDFAQIDLEITGVPPYPKV